VILESLRAPGARRVTYLVGHQSTREAALIDPGDEVGRYLSKAEHLGLRIRHAFAADYGERIPFGLLELREYPDVRIHQSDFAPFLHDVELLRPEVPVLAGALRIVLVRDALGAESFAVYDLEAGASYLALATWPEAVRGRTSHRLADTA